ncbi:MAG TPA: erythromycin esterase family protein [Bryobacteraceae bacterium]|nr:erythromycin esterase family protein [Bryobacteraceae bacterium]
MGDARATKVGRRGEWNFGQLVRERYPMHSYLIGLITHHGTVMAATGWGGEAETKQMLPGLHGSYEAFHEVAIPEFLPTPGRNIGSSRRTQGGMPCLHSQPGL